MKDLYKQLGVSDSAGETDIRAALGGATPELREAAEFILLDPARRAVYDRNRRVLVTVGQLRAGLGLNASRFWPHSRFADFTIGLNPQRPSGGVGHAIDPMRIARAFGVAPSEGHGVPRRKRHTLLLVALLAIAGASCLALLWYWKWGL